MKRSCLALILLTLATWPAHAQRNTVTVIGPVTPGDCTQFNSTNVLKDAGAPCGSGGGGAVSSVANSDGTLTVSPTTGAVVASLNLSNPNIWVAVQTFSANDLVLAGVTGSTQCLQASATGVVTGTGAVCGGSGSTGANPTATAGPVAVNGVATTFLRSDGAPAIQLATSGQFGIVEVDGTTITAAGGVISAVGGGGSVGSVTNSDGSLTISPTTGAVVASLNPAHANTWTAVQTFNANDLVLAGVTGSTQCLQASSAGVVTGTGTTCGSGGGGITALTGDVTASGSGSVAATVAKIAGVSVGTPTGTGNVVFSASPTFTGTITAAAEALSGALTINVAGSTQCLHVNTSGLVSGTGANCTSVTNSDGSLTISPTTGTVVASLNIAHANTWSGNQTFNGVSTFGAAIRVPVRTAISATDTISATADYFICPLNTSVAATENLPAGVTGLTFLIKDCGGNGATHSITVTPLSGNIDGASTFVMSTNYQSVSVTYTGAQWSIN
jgi:hypothetical protein